MFFRRITELDDSENVEPFLDKNTQPRPPTSPYQEQSLAAEPSDTPLKRKRSTMNDNMGHFRKVRIRVWEDVVGGTMTVIEQTIDQLRDRVRRLAKLVQSLGGDASEDLGLTIEGQAEKVWSSARIEKLESMVLKLMTEDDKVAGTSLLQGPFESDDESSTNANYEAHKPVIPVIAACVRPSRSQSGQSSDLSHSGFSPAEPVPLEHVQDTTHQYQRRVDAKRSSVRSRVAAKLMSADFPQIAKELLQQHGAVPKIVEAQSPHAENREDLRCWDYHCYGRRFATYSDLLRHQQGTGDKEQVLRCSHCYVSLSEVEPAKNLRMSDGKTTELCLSCYRTKADALRKVGIAIITEMAI